MLCLTQNLRKRATILIAVAYAFCVMAPVAALAFAESPTVGHCLPDTTATANATEHSGPAYANTDGAVSQNEQSGASDHHSNKDGKADTGNCCGLFCVPALAHDPGLTFGLFAPQSAAASAVVAGLIGRAPCPLHRPPIA